jgi:hypothetical protein
MRAALFALQRSAGLAGHRKQAMVRPCDLDVTVRVGQRTFRRVAVATELSRPPREGTVFGPSDAETHRAVLVGQSPVLEGADDRLVLKVEERKRAHLE